MSSHLGGLGMIQIVKNVSKDGEVISEKKKFIDDTFNEDGYRVPTHKLGAKVFADVPFPEEMSDSEIGKVARLAKLMVASSNMLGYRSHGSIVPYTETLLIEVIKLSSKRGKEFIKKMIDLGVMQINKRIVGNIESDEYYINPAYFFAGKRISLNLYILFREHLDKVIPPWVRKEFLMAAKEQAKP
jgi:hypothetical protein